MTKVKIKAILKDQVTVHIITLSFHDNNINTLKLYMENFIRLQSARLIDDGLPHIKTINFKAEEGFQFIVSELNYQHVYEFLHLSRPFFLSKEPASFEKTCSLFGKKGKGTSLTDHLKYIRSLYERGEYLPLFQISIDDVPLFHSRTLNAWLNGVEYHQDEDKRNVVKHLELALGEDTAKSIFVCQLAGRIKAIYMLAHLVNLVLKGIRAGTIPPDQRGIS